MTAWSKLPNAKHIDAVIASAKTNPKIWAEAWEKSGRWTEAWNSARREAKSVAQNLARITPLGTADGEIFGVIRDAADDVARSTAYDAARSAIMALVAYDDCAHLLTAKTEHVKMLAGIGNEAALLLYPASLVFSEIKNESLV